MTVQAKSTQMRSIRSIVVTDAYEVKNLFIFLARYIWGGSRMSSGPTWACVYKYICECIYLQWRNK